jgi:hypothetical protein
MKLYAVTKGSYSDYHIITLTRSKRRAEKIASLCSDRYDDAVVEEYDDTSIELKPIWRVMFYKYGVPRADALSYEDQLTFNEPLNTVKECGEYARFEVYVEAKGEEHAHKIAGDLVAQYCYEHDLPIRLRRRYLTPTVATREITPAQWIDYGDGLYMCSACRTIVDWHKKGCCCDACGAVMNAVVFCEEVLGYG